MNIKKAALIQTSKSWVMLSVAFIAGGGAQLIATSALAAFLPLSEFARYGTLMLQAALVAPVLSGRLDIIVIVRRRVETALVLSLSHMAIIATSLAIVACSFAVFFAASGHSEHLAPLVCVCTLVLSYLMGSFAIGILLRVGNLQRLARFRALNSFLSPMVSVGCILLSRSIEFGILAEGATRLILSILTVASIPQIRHAYPKCDLGILRRSIRLWRAFLLDFWNGSITATVGAISGFIPFFTIERLWGLESLGVVLFVVRVLSPLTQGSIQVISPQFVSSFKESTNALRTWSRYLLISVISFAFTAPIFILGASWFQSSSNSSLMNSPTLIWVTALWISFSSIPAILAHTPVLIGVHRWWLLVGIIEANFKGILAMLCLFVPSVFDVSLYLLMLCCLPLLVLATQLVALRGYSPKK